MHALDDTTIETMLLGPMKAPREHGAMLAVPALAAWPSLVEANLTWQSRHADREPFIGTTFARLRRQARQELRNACLEHQDRFSIDSPVWDDSAPLIVAGHQPEAFHAGVWVKNFAIAALASRLGGRGCNLLADHDLVKSAVVRVPSGSRDQPLQMLLSIDRRPGDVPYEMWNVGDDATFDAFGSKVRDAVVGFTDHPIVEPYWQAVSQSAKRTANVGLRLAVGRRLLEERWNARNLEASLSTLCAGNAFAFFIAGLTLDAASFAEVHNRELARFRKARHVRSQHHPFPRLATVGGRTEAPFWIWSAELPRRRPLWVERADGMFRLYAGDALALQTDGRVGLEGLAAELKSALGPWRIRPRALTTTMFLRLFVADLFVHGIGGGKYDELTDAIVAAYFGVAAPRFAVFSATCLIDSRLRFEAEAQWRAARRTKRDVYWNPDRWLDAKLREQSPVADWIERKFDLQQVDDAPRDQATFLEFRRLNERLRAYATRALQQADEAVAAAELAAANERILCARDYPFFVHDLAEIEKLIDRVASL